MSDTELDLVLASQAQLSAILETVGEGVITIDDQQSVRVVNQEVERMWGYSRDELLGRKMHLLMPHRYRDRHDAGFRRRLENPDELDSVRYLEVEGLRKNGDEFPLEVRFATLIVNGERLFTAAARDITERKEAERRLLDRSRELAQLNQEVAGLSAQLHPGALMGQLANVMVGQLRAERAYFILIEGGELNVTGRAVRDTGERTTFERWPLRECDEVAATMVRAAVEAGEDMVCSEAFDDARFSQDPYVQRTRPRSILCACLKHHGRVLGVGYLENNSAPGVYDPHRQEMARLLGSHAAISLYNARLYTSLEASNREIARLKQELERERDYLLEEVKNTGAFGEIVGGSPALGRVLQQIEAVAQTQASVLILGESGVGKELVARAIHEQSPRAEHPLVKVNCASIPADLFESEFFGHAKGAFTGAVKAREGRFQLADKGTIFLDEVGEIPLDLQGKLLRVLQEQEFEKVGEDRTRKVDVRLIAATNRDLEVEAAAGRFREDLYYRLAVFPVQVPPLRERVTDVGPLALHFLERAARELGVEQPKLTQSVVEVLEAYDWPGNIRELKNVMERAAIIARGAAVRPEMLFLGSAKRTAPPPAKAPPAKKAKARRRRGPPVEESGEERQRVEAALANNDWNIKAAAEELGMSRPALYRRIDRWGLEPD